MCGQSWMHCCRRDCVFLASSGLRGSVSLILVQAVVIESPVVQNSTSEVNSIVPESPRTLLCAVKESLVCTLTIVGKCHVAVDWCVP